MSKWHKDQGYTDKHGKPTPKTASLLGAQSRSWWYFTHTPGYIKSVAKYDPQYARQLQKGLDIMNQPDDVQPTKEGLKRWKQMDADAGKNLCENAYTYETGVCGPSPYGPNNSGNPQIAINDKGGVVRLGNNLEYGSVGGTGCVLVCAGFSIGLDGHAYVSAGGVGFGGWVISREQRRREATTILGSVSERAPLWMWVGAWWPALAQVTAMANIRSTRRVPATGGPEQIMLPGEGAFAGMMFSYEIPWKLW